MNSERRIPQSFVIGAAYRLSVFQHRPTQVNSIMHVVITAVFACSALLSDTMITPLFSLFDLAMSKTPHIQYLCGFARHGKHLYHYKFIETISSL